MQSNCCSTTSAAEGGPVDIVKPHWLVVLSQRTCASTAVHTSDAALLKRRGKEKPGIGRPTFKFAPVSESLLSHLQRRHKVKPDTAEAVAGMHLYHKRYAVMVSWTLLLRVFVRDMCRA
jgi:hypothetical protein